MQYWSGDLIERIFSAEEDEQCEVYSKVFGIRRIADQILTDRQLQVFEMRFHRGFTMQEVGDRLNITSVAVLKLEKRLVSKLQVDLFYLEELCLNDKTNDSKNM